MSLASMPSRFRGHPKTAFLADDAFIVRLAVMAGGLRVRNTQNLEPSMPEPMIHALRLSVGGKMQEICSLDEAANFIRRHPMGAHAGSLLDQIAGASNPLLTDRAWLAVATFADAMRSGNVKLRRGA